MATAAASHVQRMCLISVMNYKFPIAPVRELAYVLRVDSNQCCFLGAVCSARGSFVPAGLRVPMRAKRRADAKLGCDHRRRRLLMHAGLVVPGMLVCPAALLAATNRPRKLVFHHTHTNEKLSVVYFSDGHYHRSALERINHLLRDFRNGEVHRMDRRLLDFLHAVRLSTGTNGTFEVISGYRSPATNTMLRKAGHGVAKRSLHMKGQAIDIRLTSIDTHRLRDAAVDLRLGGVGYYRRSDFIHIDTGRFRTW